ncbi:transposase [Kitasatospora sp. SUK 42]|uniref:transposase n=1 Tax=Kitasatospora sp. SUK 42 TaxID=1588882 RepID=UPI0035AB7F73
MANTVWSPTSPRASPTPLADLPLVLVGRICSDRVMLRDLGPTRCGPKGGRPRRHDGVLTFAKPDTWQQPGVTTATDTARYGKARRWPGTGCTPGSPTSAPGWSTPRMN